MASFLNALERLRVTHEEEVSLLDAENTRLRAHLEDALSRSVPSERAPLTTASLTPVAEEAARASQPFSVGPLDAAQKEVSGEAASQPFSAVPLNSVHRDVSGKAEGQQRPERSTVSFLEESSSSESNQGEGKADPPPQERPKSSGRASTSLERALCISQMGERQSVDMCVAGVVDPFVLLDTWDLDKTRMSTRQKSRSKMADLNDNGETMTHRNSCEKRSDTCPIWSSCISYPGSKYRLTWEMVGLLLIIFDITMIPLAVFNLESDFVKTMSWVTRLFWTLDMVASLFVGYTHMGVTIMDPKLISINYLRTWFGIDVIIVVPDWVMLLLEGGADNSGMGDVRQTLRVLRVVRMLRLMRLLKLRRILTEIEDRINSEHTSIIIDLVKLLACLMSLNHLLACGWYLVGDSSVNHDGKSWIEKYDVYASNVPYRYASCLHWSLTQFTPASISIEPQNLAERVYAISVLLFAMVFFSSFVSSITSSMTHLRMLSEDKSKQMWLLRRFLRERNVQHILTTRILRYLEFACEQQRHHVQENKVTIVALLSDQLRDELKCAITLPDLAVHPLFRQIGRCSNITMKRIACTALLRKSLARGDSLFSFGDKASHMFFICSGEVRYSQPGDGLRKMVSRGSSLCEPVLWTLWVHLGDLTAVTESDHLSLDTVGFGKAVHVNPTVWQLTSNYAAGFVRCLNDVQVSSLSDMATEMMPEQHLRQMSFMMSSSLDSEAESQLEL